MAGLCLQLLSCWLLASAVHLSAVSCAGADRLVRLHLESPDQLRFEASVGVGSSPQRLRLLVDTGSSDTWVSLAVLLGGADSAGSPATQQPPTQEEAFSFEIRYGSGAVSGLTASEELQLGDVGSEGLAVPDVCVGLVDRQTPGVQTLELEGVLGLGMEALAQLDGSRSLLKALARQHHEPAVFSLYLATGSGGDHPPSQLIFGGVDPALTSANASWLSFPVAPHDQISPASSPARYGFWALRLQRLMLDGRSLPLAMPNGHSGVALLDSGTSLLLLPAQAFRAFLQILSTRLGTRLLPPSPQQNALPTCRRCQAREFPPLAFDLELESGGSRRFVLQGSDYVSCNQRRRECSALLDVVRSPAAGAADDRGVVVLGSVFLRAYYTLFDAMRRRVALACTADDRGVCLPRPQQEPVLPDPGPPLSRRLLAGVCAVATALALLAGLRLLPLRQ
ncbi:hypothetical protein BBJ28_00023279 [Nothophytophthora sp. Chile5]|nr:hypothetical protein BBJ28_00023279 [Nothophytophthora sp. Chile5]